MSDGPAHGSSSTDLSGHFSRCWNRDPVARNDLLLIRKNLTAAGVHQDLEPVNVIGAVLLMVAKRFNAREVFQSAPLLIQERFIDSKIVGIAMRKALKPSAKPSVSARILESRICARVASVASNPGSACEMNMTAAECRWLASSKVCCVQAMSA